MSFTDNKYHKLIGESRMIKWVGGGGGGLNYRWSGSVEYPPEKQGAGSSPPAIF